MKQLVMRQGNMPTGLFGGMASRCGEIMGGIFGNMLGDLVGERPCIFGHIEMGCRGDILMGLKEMR
jgi:hypothetical protein